MLYLPLQFILFLGSVLVLGPQVANNNKETEGKKEKGKRKKEPKIKLHSKLSFDRNKTTRFLTSLTVTRKMSPNE